jgi:hypothetical protein
MASEAFQVIGVRVAGSAFKASDRGGSSREERGEMLASRGESRGIVGKRKERFGTAVVAGQRRGASVGGS